MASASRSSWLRAFQLQQRLALEPAHGQQPVGRVAPARSRAHARSARRAACGGRARHAWPRGDSRAPRAGASRISAWISSVRIAGSKRWPIANTTLSWSRSASSAEAMSGYCSLQPPTSRPSRQDGVMDLAERGGERGLLVEALRTSPASPGPSSVAMRRFTKAQPIAGALACSCASSRAYSGGSASGMVASSCAAFISGPFSPPSALFSSAACLSRSSVQPR